MNSVLKSLFILTLHLLSFKSLALVVPSVQINSPMHTVTSTGCYLAANVSGIINVSLSAQNAVSGNLTISEYAVGYTLRPVGSWSQSESSLNFSYDTRQLPNGPYWLTATAYGGDNLVATAQSLIFIDNSIIVNPVADLEAPSISILSPSEGSSVSGRNLDIKVNANDNIAVSSVKCRIDGVQVASSSSAPFSMKVAMKKISYGRHVLECTASDAAGNSSISQLVNFNR